MSSRQIGLTSPDFKIDESFISQTAQKFFFWQPKKEISLPTNSQSLYLLNQIENPRYYLLRNILLDIEIDENGEVVASDSRLNVYGVGETVEQAINEFSSMLVDLFDELEDSKDVLSYHLRQQLDYLRTILALR